MSEHGPGVRWLAERSGCTPEELLADPDRLLGALAEAGREAAELALALRSPATRADAERRASALRARLDVGRGDPVAPARARLTRALRDAAERLREDTPRGPDTAG